MRWAVKRLDTISPKLLIMFDAHLGLCNSEIFKEATNIFLPYQGSNPIPFSISDDAIYKLWVDQKSTFNYYMSHSVFEHPLVDVSPVYIYKFGLILTVL